MVPARSVAEALVEALEDVPVEGRAVLVARAAEARDVLPDALRERGARVSDVALYDTVAEPLDEAALDGLERATYVTFTSSSTVRFFTESGGRVPEAARVVSIGPVTSATARELGLTVHVEAERHDIDGLVDALLPTRDGRARVIVSLLTDYGHDDEFVGVCHGVIRAIHPAREIVDMTHGIGRYDVRHGAIVLRNTLPYLPVGVHVAVVDPQVGTERRAVAAAHRRRARAGGPRQRPAQPRVGAQRRRGAGGGRDPLAAPARARVGHLPRPRRVRAGGGATWPPARELADAGDPLEPEQLVRLELPEPARGRTARWWRTRSCVDRFGNVVARRGPRAASGQRPHAGRRAWRWRSAAGAGSPPTRTPSRTWPRASCSSTRTPIGRSRSRSTAATRPRCSSVEPDAEVRLRPG